MKGDPIRAKVLSAQIIPNAEPSLLKALKVPLGTSSLGLITTDCDDVSYAALDEATKKANVSVVYAQSMYAGSANANTLLAGEFIGIIAASGPAEVKSGLDAAIQFIEKDACFYSANEDDSIIYFAHCISRTGSYLSKMARVPEGISLAYLVAPPMEAIVGIDAALKVAKLEMKTFYNPPTETNFAGGLLTGEQSACESACEAFADMVIKTADMPVAY